MVASQEADGHGYDIGVGLRGLGIRRRFRMATGMEVAHRLAGGGEADPDEREFTDGVGAGEGRRGDSEAGDAGGSPLKEDKR